MALGGQLGIVAPAYLGSSAANIYTPPASTIYRIITHIHLVNTDTVARTVSIYRGGTGGSTGGTELFKNKSIAAGETYDYYCQMKMLSTDFLSGLADSANKVTVTVEYEDVVV